ncbi:MAG: UDP-2,3-diacylglucosamine diphosphatase [Planctomycetes bacterium]|nr:UDP-2,3-diacylglucosamine diphosphatase [Planctomycetota bacterium]
MRHLFLADLHLLPGPQPGQNAKLKHFLEVTCADAEGVYFLGDLFHCWLERGDRYVGDYAEVLEIFRAAAAKGLPMHLIPGNRDFTAGELFESLSGIVCHGGEYCIAPAGTRILLAHGDAYCTSDWQYQALRWLLTGPIGKVVRAIIPWPWAEKVVRMVQNRKTVPAVYHATLASISIQTASALKAMRRRDCAVLVCGHIHFPGQRRLEEKDYHGMMYVVPDWRREGGYLEYDGKSFTPTQAEAPCVSSR